MLSSVTIKEQMALPALSGGLIPASVNGEGNSGTVDCKLFNRVCFIAMLGSGTGNGRIQQGANSNGAGMSNVSGTSVAMTANKVYTSEVRADQLTSRFVKFNFTTDAAAIIGVIGAGFVDRFMPGNDYDNTSVGSRAVANV